jgi:hypothetical protein
LSSVKIPQTTVPPFDLHDGSLILILILILSYFSIYLSIYLSLYLCLYLSISPLAQVDALTDDSILLFGRVPSATVAANTVPPTLLLPDDASDSDPIPAQLAFGPSGIETFLARLQYLNLHGQALRYGALLSQGGDN